MMMMLVDGDDDEWTSRMGTGIKERWGWNDGRYNLSMDVCDGVDVCVG